MAPPVKLPGELEEDILSRLPPLSLVRFRSVCKLWNSLFRNKKFLNNHMSRSRLQFIFLTRFKIYSIDIINHNSNDPTIELREFPFSDILDEDTHLNYVTIITACDEVLFFNYYHKTALWNPWLRQVRWIEFENNHQLHVFGLGYNNSRSGKEYKILVHFFSHGKVRRDEDYKIAIYDCSSQAMKFLDAPIDDWPMTHIAERSVVSLKGNLYWFTRKHETPQEYFIQTFDFSSENFKPFCFLPCQKNHDIEELVLGVYKGDRFSLLKQCCETREIGIWVTKERIRNNNGEGVVWIKLMTVLTANLPTLFGRVYRTSYFIYEKTLFICCDDDETSVTCIYIVREDFCKKIQVDGARFGPCIHCVYAPNLISVP